MSTSKGLGAGKLVTKCPRSYIEELRKSKLQNKLQNIEEMYMVAAAHKKREGGGARARTPPPSRKGALCACGILSIYLSNMKQIPAAACVARFWAQPPKYFSK